MLQFRSPDSSLAMIERPRCPKCQIRMMLVGVEPSWVPFLRTLECRKCELDYKALAEDPMISAKAVGWIKSELRPPRVAVSPLVTLGEAASGSMKIAGKIRLSLSTGFDAMRRAGDIAATVR